MGGLTDDQVDQLAGSIRSIAHGGTAGPAGLEMLAVALAGYGVKASVGEALHDIADAIRELSSAIQDVTASRISDPYLKGPNGCKK